MGWNTVGKYASGVKIHYATDNTAKLLVEDLQNRFDDDDFPIVPIIDKVPFFEAGHLGMVIVGQPTCVIRTLNHPIEFDCRQVEGLIKLLVVESTRRFSDESLYTKLHSSHNCLVLSEFERIDLLEELLDIEDEAYEAYKNFYNGWLSEIKERQSNEG